MTRTESMPNNTDFDDAISRLQEALEDARGMPGWGVSLVVIVSLLCFIILLHVLALFLTGPCLWAMWRHRQRLESDRLLTDEIMDTEMATELSPAEEVALEGERHS